ncbi:MAG: ECF-type sigma factor [Pirellulales bacterium]
MTVAPQEITHVLKRLQQGESQALDDLLRLIHSRLVELARAQRFGSHATMSTHDILQEGMLRILPSQELSRASNRHQLYRAFARAMRQAVIDRWRAKRALRRGGEWQRQFLDDVAEQVEQTSQLDVLDLHDALAALATDYPRAALVVELRFFGGLTMPEIVENLRQDAALAESDGTPVTPASLATLERDYRFAMAWLRSFLDAGSDTR